MTKIADTRDYRFSTAFPGRVIDLVKQEADASLGEIGNYDVLLDGERIGSVEGYREESTSTYAGTMIGYSRGTSTNWYPRGKGYRGGYRHTTRAGAVWVLVKHAVSVAEEAARVAAREAQVAETIVPEVDADEVIVLSGKFAADVDDVVIEHVEEAPFSSYPDIDAVEAVLLDAREELRTAIYEDATREVLATARGKVEGVRLARRALYLAHGLDPATDVAKVQTEAPFVDPLGRLVGDVLIEDGGRQHEFRVVGIRAHSGGFRAGQTDYLVERIGARAPLQQWLAAELFQKN